MAKEQKFLELRNWKKYQHYKNRNPPWIKLHWELLASADWVMIPDASKLLAIVCMLVASRNNGLIPDSPDYFKRVAYLDQRPNFKPLIECGFLIKLQAKNEGCKQHDKNYAPEREGETYSKEVDNKDIEAAPSKLKRKIGTRISEDWVLSQKDINHAKSKGYSYEQAKQLAEQFINHWLQATGKGSTSLDWCRKWITWVGNDIKWNGNPKDRGRGGNGKGSSGNQSGNSSFLDHFSRVGGELWGEDGELPSGKLFDEKKSENCNGPIIEHDETSF